MANDFSNPFLRGYQGSQENARRGELANVQTLGGLLNIQNSMTQQQDAQEMNPLKRQLLQAQIGQAQQPKYQSIGAGGLLGPNGEMIAPQARPQPIERWSDPYPLNGAMVQKNETTGQVRQAVNREPVTRVTNNIPAPITAVTIQDPNDPNGTIIIDGRTRQPLGKGPKFSDAGKMEAKREFNMQGIGATIQAADDLLSGAGGKPLPTGSGVGTALDFGASIIGVSPSGSEEADRLRSVGAALVSKMPRMEGPQSDKDVALYKEAAGRIGDSTIPVDRRKAALDTVKNLWAKYERLNPDAFADRRAPGGGGGAPKVIDFSALPPG